MFYRNEKNTTYSLSMYNYLDIKISVKYLKKYLVTSIRVIVCLLKDN